jgi:hypothetical protein
MRRLHVIDAEVDNGCSLLLDCVHWGGSNERSREEEVEEDDDDRCCVVGWMNNKSTKCRPKKRKIP